VKGTETRDGGEIPPRRTLRLKKKKPAA